MNDEQRADVIPLRPEGHDVVQDAEIVDEPRETYNTRVVAPVSIPHVREAMARGTEVAVRASVPAAKTTGSAIARHTLYIAAGIAVIRHRRKDSRTTDPYVRAMHAAEAAGDWEKVSEWADRIERAKNDKHRRRMDLIKSPKEIAKALVIAASVVPLVLLTIGVAMAINEGSFAAIADPFEALATAVATAVWFVTAYSMLLVGGGTAGLLWYLNRLGKRHGERHMPAWGGPVARKERVTGEGEPVTPHRVIAALSDLGISTLRKKLAELGEGSATLLGPVTIAGCGVEVDVTLPTGVTTEEIKAKRRKLAENLDRHEHELFITTAPAARTVRLWVADPGALDEPIEPSPLVLNNEITANVHSGRAPWGQNLRGDAISLNLWQKHLLITGVSNMGKTASLRSLVLWAAFDPTTELRIADLKGIGDWHMFKGIATTLIEGPTDDHVIEATHMLERGVEEMERRLLNLDKDKYPDGVPPNLPGFHPIFLIVDEAQVAFMCPAVGEGEGEFRDPRPFGGQKNTSRYFMAARKIHNQGRAVNVVLWQGTQDPTDQNLPKMVREGAHIRASLKVGTPQQSRMALGPAPVDAGAAPHELKDEHKGTVVVVGPGVPRQQGQPAETVRTHFVSGSEATEIAERIKAVRGECAARVEEVEEVRDLLADVSEVLRGEPKVKATDVAARLRELAPGYRPYKGLDGTRVRELLTDAGVRVTASDGYPVVRPERVAEAIAKRGTAQE